MRTIVKLLLAGALLAPAAANAQDLLIRRTCIGHRSNCTITVTRPANTGIAKTVEVPADPEADAPVADSYEFQRICQPQIVVDKHGVSRYVFAHKGCDAGQIPNGDQH